MYFAPVVFGRTGTQKKKTDDDSRIAQLCERKIHDDEVVGKAAMLHRVLCCFAFQADVHAWNAYGDAKASKIFRILEKNIFNVS